MKVRFGMLMTDAVGKAGGQFIQRTRFGNVLRNITIPVQRLASLQNPQRVATSYVFSRWFVFSSAEREMWDIIGLNMRKKNTFGEDIVLSGREAFSRCSSIIYPYNGSYVSPYNFNYTMPAIEISQIILDVSNGELLIAIASKADVDFWQIKAMPLKNSSINLSVDKLKTFMRSNDITDENNVYANFINMFAYVNQNKYVMFAVRGVSNFGIVSEWQVFKVQAI